MAIEPEDELLSSVYRKLLVSVPQFDRARGSAFSFVSKLTLNQLATAVTRRKKLSNRFPPLDRTMMLTLPDQSADFDSRLAVADLEHQIYSIKSALTGPEERQAQRWLIQSFLDCGFSLLRHETAKRLHESFFFSLSQEGRPAGSNGAAWDSRRPSRKVPSAISSHTLETGVARLKVSSFILSYLFRTINAKFDRKFGLWLTLI